MFTDKIKILPSKPHIVIIFFSIILSVVLKLCGYKNGYYHTVDSMLVYTCLFLLWLYVEFKIIYFSASEVVVINCLGIKRKIKSERIKAIQFVKRKRRLYQHYYLIITLGDHRVWNESSEAIELFGLFSFKVIKLTISAKNFPIYFNAIKECYPKVIFIDCDEVIRKL